MRLTSLVALAGILTFGGTPAVLASGNDDPQREASATSADSPQDREVFVLTEEYLLIAAADPTLASLFDEEPALDELLLDDSIDLGSADPGIAFHETTIAYLLVGPGER